MTSRVYIVTDDYFKAMLNNVNNKNPFKVPENYFDNFHAEMMSKIGQSPAPAKVVPLWRKVLPWTSVAAAVCGVVISISVFFNTSTENTHVSKKDAEFYASTDDDYFMMFLEDQAISSSYDDIVYASFSN